ncbi:MAG: hypothetical protein K2K37_03880, partial [Muribaculaceae bacterium]|nr:hypothetical protein [Muribaculaceae bacterium]
AIVALSASAQSDDMSASKRINKIKRDGSYIYAEATAATEAEAKSLCDDIIKVEISKYVASKRNLTSADQLIIKDANYDKEYLSMPRGEMTRVFIYVKKSDIEAGGSNVTTMSAGEIKSINEAQTRSKEEVAASSTASVESQATEKAPSPAPQTPNASFQQTQTTPASQTIAERSQPARNTALATSDTELSKWQIGILNEIVFDCNMAGVKRILNRKKLLNQVTRFGDNTTAPTGPSMVCYAVFGDNGQLEALLVPGKHSPFIDVITGQATDISKFPSNKYLWFTLSK